MCNPGTHAHKQTQLSWGLRKTKVEVVVRYTVRAAPRKHERSRLTSPRRLSGSYFPVTLSHTGCLSPRRRGHDTLDNSQQPLPPSLTGWHGAEWLDIDETRTKKFALFAVTSDTNAWCHISPLLLLQRTPPRNKIISSPAHRLFLNLAVVYHTLSMWFSVWKTGFQTCIVSYLGIATALIYLNNTWR